MSGASARRTMGWPTPVKDLCIPNVSHFSFLATIDHVPVAAMVGRGSNELIISSVVALVALALLDSSCRVLLMSLLTTALALGCAINVACSRGGADVRNTRRVSR